MNRRKGIIGALAYAMAMMGLNAKPQEPLWTANHIFIGAAKPTLLVIDLSENAINLEVKFKDETIKITPEEIMEALRSPKAKQ